MKPAPPEFSLRMTEFLARLLEASDRPGWPDSTYNIRRRRRFSEKKAR
jgi:hypothetical protein